MMLLSYNDFFVWVSIWQKSVSEYFLIYLLSYNTDKIKNLCILQSFLYFVTFLICKKGKLVQHFTCITKHGGKDGVGEGFVQLCFSNSWEEYIKIMHIYNFESSWTPGFWGKPKHKIMFHNAITSVTLIKAGYIVAVNGRINVQAQMILPAGLLTLNILLIFSIWP